MIDFISNNLTCLRNSNLAKHDSVNIKYSKLTVEILNILKREGYIRDYQIDNNDIKVILKYKGWWFKNGVFNKLISISTPGKRVFSGYKYFINKVKNLSLNEGILVISTSSGILTHLDAIKFKKGGEILFYIS
jgi:small subunit ribosomal protein S8